jgi:hypothetical protein
VGHPVAVASAMIGVGTTGRGDLDVLQSQHDLMQSAVAQSEQEFIQKALEDSLKTASGQDEVERALLESARIASLQASAGLQGRDSHGVGEDDEDMQWALQLSHLSEEELQRALHESQQLPTSRPATATNMTEAPQVVSNDDAELQEAIRLSLQQAAGGRGGHQLSEDEIAAAELEAAIQASMREL